MTQPKRHLPGQFVEITRRTTRRRFLLRPGKDTRDLVGYMYGKALLDHNQTASAAFCMSNHVHSAQLDREGTRSGFMQQFFSNTTRKRNLQLDRRENLWAVGEPGDMVLLELQEIIDKIVYVCLQAVAAGCVEKATDWSGFKILPKDWGKPMRFPRPRHCGKDMPEFVEFTPMPPPGFEDLPLDEVIAFFEHLIAKAEQRYARNRTVPVLGIKACEARSPFHVPNTKAAMRELNPQFSSRNKAAIVKALRHQRACRQAHRMALTEFRDGKRDVVFPSGTILMARRAGVRCAAVSRDDPHLTRAKWTASLQKQWDDWPRLRAA